MSTQSKQEVRVHIRWMIRRDMPEVLAIEEDSFEFPWSEEEFLRCLRQRNCIGMVAEHDERVVGFMIYELNKTRIHVLNFAVARDHRRLGVGKQMISKLIGKLSSQRRARIILEVRETNLPAQLFFARAGSGRCRSCGASTKTRRKTPTSCTTATGRRPPGCKPRTTESGGWPVESGPA